MLRLILVTTCVLSFSLANAHNSMEIDPLPREALEHLKGIKRSKDVLLIKIVAIRLSQDNTTSQVIDKMKVKFPVQYEKAVNVGQILKNKLGKMTTESRNFVREVLIKSSITPSLFAHESELENSQVVEVVKSYVKLRRETRGYIKYYFPRMDSFIWRIINRYYVRGMEKELRN